MRNIADSLLLLKYSSTTDLQTLVLLKICYRYSTFYTVKIKRSQGHFKCRLYKYS